jgi:hypothetical protein
MAIKITDNFQVNIKNPIDNRFVVGSQSIPGGTGSIYPTPFYAYRDDISSNIGFVYPGLRIWDFNDNLPYVWTGTTWSNENLTGASVLNSGDPAFSAGGGYQNYITKFYDTSTVLTKSLLFDNNVHVSLDVSPANPNSSGGAGNPQLIASAVSVLKGLHVKGRIRTNSGFVGDGSYIHNINAANINGGPASGQPGRLDLRWIDTGGLITTTTNNPYLLTTIGSSTTTSWKKLLDIVPFWSPTNLGNGVPLYSGNNPSSQLYEFFSLVSSGLQIDPAVSGSVRIESKPAVNVGGGSASVYKGLATSGDKVHEFKTISSNFINITQTSDVINLNSNITSSSLNIIQNPTDAHGITIEIPASFDSTDYYVNGRYYGAEQLGTRSKPFNQLRTCINKILNRSSNSGPYAVPNGIGPTDTFDANINNGLPFEKYDPRYSIPPERRAVRVIIQTYCRVTENLAINNVTYFLESESSSSLAVEFFNFDGVNDNAPNLEWVIDMKELVDSIPAHNPSNPISRSFDGSLPYPIITAIEGSGRVYFSGAHLKRKGFFRSYATNGYDYKGKINGDQTGNKDPQNSCQLLVGSIGGKLNLEMYPLIRSSFPAPIGEAGSHIAGTVSLFAPAEPAVLTPAGLPVDDADNNIIVRESTRMVGFMISSEPDYGCIQVEGRNFQFYESLFLKGTIVINAQEQHMIYLKDYGTGYSEDCRIYMRRNYQNVLIDNLSVPWKYVQIYDSTSLNLIDDAGAVKGDYFIITTLGTGGNWGAISTAGTWRNANGTLANGTGNLTTGPQLGWAFKWNGTPSSVGGTPRVARCRKQYLPCKHVYDIYLKNGGRFNHGGDFYTQQNTGANQGGPDSFACLRNDFTDSGSLTSTNWYPSNNGQSTTFCEFRSTGGGFITNLIYNHYIKTIYNSTYNTYRNHNIIFRNLKIDSNAYSSVFRIQDTIGFTWTKTHGFGGFYNCLFGDYTIPYSQRRATFSNQPVWTREPGQETGKIILFGTRIDLSNASLDTIIVPYATSNLAIAAGLSSGCLYKVPTTGEIKIIP